MKDFCFKNKSFSIDLDLFTASIIDVIVNLDNDPSGLESKVEEAPVKCQCQCQHMHGHIVIFVKEIIDSKLVYV